MTEHGIRFVQLLDTAGDDLHIDLQITGQLLLLGALVGDELVERRRKPPGSDPATARSLAGVHKRPRLAPRPPRSCLDACVPTGARAPPPDTQLSVPAPP